MTADRPLALGISGSPSPDSSSRRVASAVLQRLDGRGFETRTVDLAELPADVLLARPDGGEGDAAVRAALEAVERASVLVVSTPIYRATYTALLKTIFDLMPQDALSGKVAVLIATGYGAGHLLAIDHGLRPLIASLGGLSAATGIYATADHFDDGNPNPALDGRIVQAAVEAAALSGATGLSVAEAG